MSIKMETLKLCNSYEFEGKRYAIADYVERNQTTGLIILKGMCDLVAQVFV